MKLKDQVKELKNKGKNPMEIARELKQAPFIIHQILKGINNK